MATINLTETEFECAVAAASGVTSIPMLMIFRDGILLFNRAGN